MGAASSAAGAAAAASTDKQFRRGKLACRFLMISNCALAVYIITRPRKRERSKGGNAGTPAAQDDEAHRDAMQLQQMSDLNAAESGKLYLARNLVDRGSDE